MQQPTIGRVVHVHLRVGALDSRQPEAATIAYVHGPTCVNVGGFDHDGKPFSATSVAFHEEGSTAPKPQYTWAEFPPRF